MTDKQNALPGVTPWLFIGAYFGLSFARSDGWFPQSWSLIPVVETAWMNFLLVLGVILWIRMKKIPLARVGFGAFQPSRSLLLLVVGTMVVDSLAIGMATPALERIFGEAPSVARFENIPGNLPLLLFMLPVSWLIAAFGEEFFFRGFLLTAIAGFLGASRAAWIVAVFIQATAFGLIHAYQGPAQAISIAIGGAVYGAAFLVARKSLWPLILAHGINDTLGFILLYSGVIVR